MPSPVCQPGSAVELAAAVCPGRGAARAPLSRENLFFLILFTTLLFSPPADFASIFLQYLDSPLSRVSLVVRAVVSLAALGMVVVYARRFPLAILMLVSCSLIPLFGLGLNFLTAPWFGTSTYVESILLVIKLVSIPLVCVVTLRFVSPGQARRLFELADWVFISYVLFVIVGAATQHEMFRSYTMEYRPGFKGIISAANEASGSYLIFVAWLFVRSQLGSCSRWWFWLAFVSSFLVGTKALWGFVPLLVFLLYVAFHGWRKGLWLGGVLITILVVVVVGVYLYYEPVQLALDLMAKAAEYQFHHFLGSSWTGLITSGRTVKFDKLFGMAIQNWPLFPVFGGIPVAGYLSEMDPFDIVALGGIPYLFVTGWSYWVIFLRNQERLPPTNRMVLKSFLYLWSIIATIGGHLLFGGGFGPFLAVLLLYLRSVDLTPPGGRGAAAAAAVV